MRHEWQIREVSKESRGGTQKQRAHSEEFDVDEGIILK
jgi:hypothetical protein